MTEEKELCPSCDNPRFSIVRDMTARRFCSCGYYWDAPEKKDTGYKRLKRERDKYVTK